MIFRFCLKSIKTLEESSKESGKYKNIMKAIKKFDSEIKECKEARVVYLVPENIKKTLAEKMKDNNSFTVLSFSELPESIPNSCRFSDEWAIIRENFKEIDRGSQRFRNGQSMENSRVNYKGKVNFSEIIEKCEDARNLIHVGFKGGIDMLKSQSIGELEKKKFKWDLAEGGSGNKVLRNWINGDVFLEVIGRLRQES